MEIAPVKKRIIIWLFSIALVLLAATVVTSKILNQKGYASQSDLDVNGINNQFLHDLNNFGLKSDWIRKTKNKNQGFRFSYIVSLPKDLPIPVVLSEIYGSYFSSDIKIKSMEKVIKGKTVIEIYQRQNNVLTAEFDYDEDIKRDAGNMGILAFGLDKLNTKDLKAMIEFPQASISLLEPSKNSLKLLPEIIENRKEFAVLINDNISDLDYKLSSSYAEYRLKPALRSIIGDFSNAVFFVIDDHSRLYSSPAGEIVKSEFAKRKIKLVTLSSLPDYISGTDVKELFRNRVKAVHLGNNKLISIKAGDFEVLKPEIFGLIKVGYKFINPSIIINPNNQNE